MFLVVTSPFGRFERGDAITADDDIAHALREHPLSVVRVGADAAPAVSHVELEPEQAASEA